MKRGLVIGKFLPVHAGHLALIRFAATQCDELIVSLSEHRDDPIEIVLRQKWLKEELQEMPTVKLEIAIDDFDDPSLAWPQRTAIWAAFIRKRYPQVDVLFTSEEYGPFLAAHLNVPHISFDPMRRKFPVSASLIRSDPYRYWEYIPQSVRHYFLKKVCFFGPESTGKSYMAERLAALYATMFVPEVAREMITSNDFTLGDIVDIANAQTERVLEKAKMANRILFCDTDVITTQIYSAHYLHEVPDVVRQLERAVQYDRYFLFDIDVPWVADHLRDLGSRRKEMFEVFRVALEERHIPYILVKGSFEEREGILRREVDSMLGGEYGIS